MKHFGAVTEPLGLAFIAGVLESSGVNVIIIDAPAQGFNINDVCEKIDRFNIDIVGVTLLTPSFGVVNDLCDQIKALCPKVITILGGPHCTALPERTLSEIPSADLVCFGEGELTMKEVVQNVDEKCYASIFGLCWRNDKGDIIKNPPRPYIKDIDSIPMPARHLLPMDRYHLTASRLTMTLIVPLLLLPEDVPLGAHIAHITLEEKYGFTVLSVLFPKLIF